MGSIEYLKSLRNNLANGKMSLLVGAGFSKNVSYLFPDWIELLQDLVYELYEDEIESRIQSDISEDEREKQLLLVTRKIIDKVGFLKIVSEYISRKGYEESIVAYIERHTPIEETNEGEYYLIEKDGSRNLLTDDKLHLHKLLLSFPWNNVYTTNYDPLLEASVDTKLHNKLKEENDILLKSINELDKSVKSNKENEERISQKLNDLDAILNSSKLKVYPADDAIDETSVLEELIKDRNLLFQELNKLRSTIWQCEHESHSKQRQYSANVALADNCYTVVADGAKLSLKKSKNIIKLHGSLRSMAERNQHKFDFDNDPRKQYIISAEHYTHYPQKHEAFTQLMRIALLQESFCLIGFSGVDPNFTAWIGWVRDLLYKSSLKHGEQPEHKIYLVEMSGGELQEDDRQLYYENHRIARIPLLNSEVINFLEKETKQQLNKKNTYGSALQLLFNFLANHDSLALSIAPKDSSVDDQWQGMWSKVTKLESNNVQVDEDKIIEMNDAIPILASKIVIPDLSKNGAYYQYDFLDRFNNYASKLPVSSEENMFSLLVHLTPKLFLPINSVVTESVLQILLAKESTKEKTKELLEINAILKDPTSTVPSTPLNKVLQYAFTFDYGELQQNLEQWDASIEELHIKAGFLAQFNPLESIHLLETQLMSGKIGDQQRMFSYELLSIIKWGVHLDYSDKLRYYIGQYRKAGYSSFIDILSELADSLNRKEKGTLPYGAGRFSDSDDSTSNNPRDLYPSFQFLYIITQFGFPLQIGNTTLIARERWYRIFKGGFEQFPLPFIYYALHYKNENIQRRIGQDIAWSDKLATYKPIIVKYLFRAFDHHRDSTMILLSELFNVVDPEEWEADFAMTWKKLVTAETVYDPYKTVCEQYARVAFRFIRSKTILYSIVTEVLEMLNQHPDSSISYLYHLNSNLFFKKEDKNHLPNTLTNCINDVISNLGQSPINSLFALGNLFFLLTEEQLDHCCQNLKSINFSDVGNSRALRIALFFAKNDATIVDKIRQVLLIHPELWATGIHNNTIHGGQQMLSIMNFTKRNNSKHGISFGSQDLKTIFEKLIVALSDIQRIHFERRDSFIEFTSVLHEMRTFLTYFRSELVQYPEYNSAYNDASEAFFDYAGYNEIVEGLSNGKKSSAIWALTELSELVEHSGFDNEQMALLLNKLLLQKEPSLEAGLNYLSVWLDDEKNHARFEEFSESILRILRKYHQYPLPEANKPFVEEMLVKIAYSLQKMKIDDPIITKWLILDNMSFNSTKQWFTSKEADTANLYS